MKKKMKDFEHLYLRQCTFTATMTRVKSGSDRRWVKTCQRSKKSGHVVGIRRYQNGIAAYVEDGVREFLPQESIIILLVATSPYSVPMAVLPEDCYFWELQ